MENRFDLSAAALHILAMAFMLMDHYGMGVLTVFAFCFFHGREWWKLLGQILTLYWLNVQALSGQLYLISAFGAELELCQQGLALLAPVPPSGSIMGGRVTTARCFSMSVIRFIRYT